MKITSKNEIIGQIEARELLARHHIELDVTDRRNAQQYASELLLAIQFRLGEETIEHEVARFAPNTTPTNVSLVKNITPRAPLDASIYFVH